MAKKRAAAPGTEADPGGGPPATPARAPQRGAWIVGGLLLAAAIALGLWALRGPVHQASPAATPAQAPLTTAPASHVAGLGPATYVDNQLCLGCHQEQAAQWRPSHHAKAMAAPNAATVRGDFNDTQFKHQGVTSRFFRRDDKFFVHTDGPDGKLADFEIAYTFGVEPLQQYLIATAGRAPAAAADRLGHARAEAGSTCCRTRRRRRATCCTGPAATRPPTRCASPATPPASRSATTRPADSFASTWKEPNVSCQSCHGPGERHAQWARLKAEGTTRADAGRRALRPGGGLARRQAPAASGGLRRLPFAPQRAHGHAGARPAAARPLPAEPADATACTTPTASSSTRSSSTAPSARARCTARAWAAPTATTRTPASCKLAGNAVCLQCHAAPAERGVPERRGHLRHAAHHFHKPARRARSAWPATCRRRTTCRSSRGPITACACRGRT